MRKYLIISLIIYASAFNLASQELIVFKCDNDKCGLKDDKGNIIMECKYSSIGEFNKYGLAKVYIKPPIPLAKNRFGYINKTGKEVIECKYKLLGDFNDGLVDFMLDNERYGYMDDKGSIVIPAKYQRASGFWFGKAKVAYGDREYCIDKKGNEVPCD